MLTSKRTTLYIDDDVAALAKIIGITNFSETFREMLEFLVSSSDEEMTRSQIRNKLKEYAQMKRADLKSQMKIVEETETEKQIRSKRFAVIVESVRKEAARIGFDRFERYLEDPNGDYTTVQDDIVLSVSKDAGREVTLADVIKAFKAVKI
jgi:hypothetical protein